MIERSSEVMEAIARRQHAPNRQGMNPMKTKRVAGRVIASLGNGKIRLRLLERGDFRLER
jgi:hypothetical protein